MKFEIGQKVFVSTELGYFDTDIPGIVKESMGDLYRVSFNGETAITFFEDNLLPIH